MTKIIDLYKNNNLPESDIFKKIKEEDVQEDLDEKKRKNKRFEKWDNLLFNLVHVIIVLLVLDAFGIIKLPLSFDYFLGTGGLTTIITAIFRTIKKQNSS